MNVAFMIKGSLGHLDVKEIEDALAGSMSVSVAARRIGVSRFALAHALERDQSIPRIVTRFGILIHESWVDGMRDKLCVR